MSLTSDASAPSVAPQEPRLYLIAAMARNGVIGAGGKMPWHLPDDLRHFKKITLGHPVIMGRRTWDSLGKPLPGRTNIVITRRTGRGITGALVAGSLQAAMSLCSGHDTVYVIGGAEIYALALPHADGLVLTEIDFDRDGDTFFPAWDRGAFMETQRETHTAEGVRFDFVRYERRIG